MNFALITEGASEYRIIKHIITKYFKTEEPLINQIYPRIINGKQDLNTPGGWNEVLKFCGRFDMDSIFVENDYLIIQIDSDRCQTKPFNVSDTKSDNTKKTIEELHTDIVARIYENIKSTIKDQYQNNILFAICVNTIECWLLPIYYNNHHRCDTSNCLYTLNSALEKNKIHRLPSRSKDKNNATSVCTYNQVLNNWKRKKDISSSAQFNPSFRLFVESLASIN